MSAPQSRTAVKAARTDEPEALKGAFILPRLRRRFRVLVEESAELVATPDQFKEPERARFPQRPSDPRTRSGSTIRRAPSSTLADRPRWTLVSWAMRPGRRRSLRQGAAVLSCRRGESTANSGPGHPRSVRTGPRMSFSPPQSMGRHGATETSSAPLVSRFSPPRSRSPMDVRLAVPL